MLALVVLDGGATVYLDAFLLCQGSFNPAEYVYPRPAPLWEARVDHLCWGSFFLPVRLNMLMHCPAPLGLRTCLLFLTLPLWTIADSQETADYTASVERIKAAGGDVVVSEAYASSSGIREILADLGAPKLALNGTVRCVSSCLSPGPGHGTMKGAVIQSSHSVGVGWLKKHGSFVSALMVAIVLMLQHRRVSNSYMVVCVSLDDAHAFTPFCRSSLLPHALWCADGMHVPLAYTL